MRQREFNRHSMNYFPRCLVFTRAFLLFDIWLLYNSRETQQTKIILAAARGAERSYKFNDYPGAQRASYR